MNPIALVVAAGLLGAGGGTAEDDATRADLDRLRGKWAAVAIEINGEAVPEDFLKSASLAIEGDRYAPEVGQAVAPSTIKLDPSRRPKTIDFKYLSGPQEGQTVRGIYKVEGDRLTICRGLSPDTERPAEFTSGAESGLVMSVWRRSGPAPRAQSKPDAAAVAAELKRFAGTWRISSMTNDGRSAPEAAYKEAKLILEGDRFSFVFPEGTFKGTFAIDPTATPKTIDVTFTDGPNAGEVVHGIYDLEGDTYRVCMKHASPERPKALESKPGSGEVLQVLKREKP